jgi:hypothetical protein
MIDIFYHGERRRVNSGSARFVGRELEPAVYPIDKHGQVRYRWDGELEWQHAGGEAVMARLVNRLLKERR